MKFWPRNVQADERRWPEHRTADYEARVAACRLPGAAGPQSKGSSSWGLPAPAKQPIPAPWHERLPGSRARLGGRRLSPGWPLSRNDSTGAARGLRRKIVLLSSDLRGFAPSREIRDFGPTSLAHKRRTQEREPWTRDKDAAPSMGLPGEASPQLAWIANRKDADIQEDIRRRVFVRPLCALCSLW